MDELPEPPFLFTISFAKDDRLIVEKVLCECIGVVERI